MPKIKDIIKFATLFYGVWVATRKIMKAGEAVREVVVTRSEREPDLSELYWRQRIFSNKPDRGDA